MSETDVGLSELPDGWAWLTDGRLPSRVHLTGKSADKCKSETMRKAGKSSSELYPYYGATGQVGYW